MQRVLPVSGSKARRIINDIDKDFERIALMIKDRTQTVEVVAREKATGLHWAISYPKTDHHGPFSGQDVVFFQNVLSVHTWAPVWASVEVPLKLATL